MKVIKHATKEQKPETIIWLREFKPHAFKRLCNLCHEEFKPASKFDRFCHECKEDNELYHFAEWLAS